MNQIVFSITVIITVGVFSTNINAQVVNKDSDKWQLKNGVKLETINYKNKPIFI